VVLDAPLLIEVGWSDLVDEIWLTVAPKKVILQRLRKKGISARDVETRMRAQMGDAQKRKHAHRIISTDTDLNNLRKTVIENFNDFKAKMY
jgi:dephospho-CoA kinase